jgi:hypothetical protein
MKLKWICLFVLSAMAMGTTGCVKTLDDRRSAGVPFGRDRVEGRYERTPAELWTAAKDVLTHQGTLTGHDTLLNVLEASVDERRLWVKVEEVDSKISRVIVQARTKSGVADMEMAAFIDKQIAVRLAAGNLAPGAPVRRQP